MRASRAASLALLPFALCAACGETPGGVPIRIDGDLSDWDGVPVAWSRDAPSPAGPGLASLRLVDDPLALHLAIALDEPANIQGLSGSLLIVLDADADARTGTEVLGLRGAELVVAFTRLLAASDGTLAAAQGTQAWIPDPGMERPGVAPDEVLSPYDLGLAFEPRSETREVEVRLPRGGGPGGVPLGARAVRLRVVLLDEGARPVSGTRIVTYRFGRGRPRPPRRIEALERADGTDVRLLVWNVSRHNLRTRSPEIARILAALDPDVVLFDEVTPGEPASSVAGVLPGPRAEWSVRIGTSGSRQTGAIAARGGLGAAPSFDRVPLPDSVRRWLGSPAMADLTEVRDDVDGGGTPAAAGWVRPPAGGRLLAVAIGLICCGNSLVSPEDRTRRVQAEAIRAAVRAELDDARSDSGGPTGPAQAVVIAGDFNLVGSELPLHLAGRGLDDGEDLAVVDALQLDGIFSATWSAGAGPFPPARLDYVLYSPSRLRPLRAFVFETPDLTGAELEARGLEREDSDRASDHRPVVVDFAWGGGEGGGAPGRPATPGGPGGDEGGGAAPRRYP